MYPPPIGPRPCLMGPRPQTGNPWSANDSGHRAPENPIDIMLSVYCCFQYRHGHGSVTSQCPQDPGKGFRTLEFGEIPNFCRQAEQAGKLTHIKLYFHIKIQQCVFLILHESV